MLSTLSTFSTDALLFEFRTGIGPVRVYRRIPEELQTLWEGGLAFSPTDARYYEILAATLNDQFEHLYLALADESGTFRAVQPFLLVKQDLVMGTPDSVRRAVAKVRQRFAGFLELPMIMIGCSAGEGDLAMDGVTGGFEWTATALQAAILPVARHLKATMIVFKDFPKHYRSVLDSFAKSGFTRIPSMPATGLDLGFPSFEAYMQDRLSHAMRKNLRRKFRKTEKVDLSFSVDPDISSIVDELVPLYRAVFNRAKQRFEELNRDYFLRLNARMPDRARFLVWRLKGKIVAFASCLVHDGVVRDNYIGLDYSVALDHHLYYVTWRDTVSWAISEGYRHYHSAPLNYDPKLHFRMELEPLDLYVRAVNNVLNPVFRPFLPWLEPTRYDRAIQQFANAADLR
ncbi:MAG: GNAT family N-acetyltransferase [Verrucomicrobia bacterium]|nr:GNAT family N-acetyltransferase [Verrucomicrobiota bacterium]